MLTRKQLWYKTLKKQPVKKFKGCYGFCFDNCIDREEEFKIESISPKKKLHFNKIVNVHCISPVNEEIKTEIWWSENDYIKFKIDHEIYLEKIKKFGKYNSI